MPGRFVCTLMMGILLLGAGVRGEVPFVISHQGRLLDDAGRPISAKLTIGLELFDAPTRGGSLYRMSKVLTVVDGLFTFNLGEGAAVPEDLKDALQGGEAWVEITVDGQTLSPRERLQSVPYAVWASQLVDGAIDTDTLADDAVTSAKVLDGSILPEDLNTEQEDAYHEVFRSLAPLMKGAPLPIDLLGQTTCLPSPQSAFQLTVGATTYPDVLGFRAEEAVSELSRVEILFTHGGTPLKPQGLVDQPAQFSYVRHGLTRTFAGIITEAAIMGAKEGIYRHAVVIEPHLARLRTSRRYAIFQDQDVQEAFGEIATGYGLGGTFDTGVSLEQQEQTIQYDETDLDFLSRWLEREGLWYVLDQAVPEANVQVGNQNSGFPDQGILLYYGDFIPPSRPEEEYMLRMTHGFTLRARDHTSVSWDDIQGISFAHTDSISGGDAIGTIVRLEDRVRDAGTIASRAESGMLREYHDRQVIVGLSNAGNLRAGARIRLGDNVGAGLGVHYPVTRVEHTGFVVPGTSNCFFYANRCELIADGRPYRPPLRTPVPKVSGLSYGTVSGPGGEKVYVDEWGRVKVRFHWDTLAPTDEHASGWIPVMQDVHGAGQTSFFLPEVGDEVLVAFMDGNVDRPIVVGSVPNPSSPTPYPLPDERLTSTLRAESDGGVVTEVRMKRENGGEELLLRSRDVVLGAEGEMLFTAGEGLSGSVGENLHLTVGNAADIDVGGQLTLQTPELDFRGILQFNTELGNAGVYQPGRAFEDNQLVAWGRVAASGVLGNEHFGIANLTHPAKGMYVVDIDARFSLQGLVPVASPEVDAQPTALGDVVFAMINQLTTGRFEVFLNDGNGHPTDNDFTFMVTGRP